MYTVCLMKLHSSHKHRRQYFHYGQKEFFQHLNVFYSPNICNNIHINLKLICNQGFFLSFIELAVPLYFFDVLNIRNKIPEPSQFQNDIFQFLHPSLSSNLLENNYLYLQSLIPELIYYFLLIQVPLSLIVYYVLDILLFF